MADHDSTSLVPTDPTMTSLELVEMVNTHRAAQVDRDRLADPEAKKPAVLSHADFMKKVPKVIGGHAGNFSGVYLGANGEQRPCYRFPKREACLMAMSYSYELQAQTFDKMTALEVHVAELAAPAAPVALLPNPLAEQLVTVHAGQIAELLSQQSRLIALLEQRPAASAAPPAPAPRPQRPQATHLTVAGRLAMENVQVDAATKRAINNAVLADYRRNNKPFAVTVNGYGLFHIQRIDFHTRRILGMPGGQQQTLEF